jgi:hypothetical protein
MPQLWTRSDRMFFQNDGIHMQDYIMSQHRRIKSKQSLPWKPQNILIKAFLHVRNILWIPWNGNLEPCCIYTYIMMFLLDQNLVSVASCISEFNSSTSPATTKM